MWHTQGSGKSMEMELYAAKVMRHERLANPTVVVITDRTELVHVSGHPRRDEMADFYAWTRPKTAIPVHGEALHLDEHARFARDQGVPNIVKARNGSVVRLAPGTPEIVDHVKAGRLFKDGNVLIDAKDWHYEALNRALEAGWSALLEG